MTASRASFHEVVPDDETLVAQAVAGSERAFAALYRRHARYVAGVVYRVMGSDADLDDVVQEAFVDASRALGAFKEVSSLRAWLGRIAVRRIHKRLARRRRWRWFLNEEQHNTVTVSEPRVGARIEDLYEALEALPPKARIPWVLHCIEGETLPDVAVMCDVSLATVKRRIASASAHVNRKLHETV
jgi:RNA polymerase sigma-70 factor (ECF subfamily)